MLAADWAVWLAVLLVDEKADEMVENLAVLLVVLLADEKADETAVKLVACWVECLVDPKVGELAEQLDSLKADLRAVLSAVYLAD